ncbi:MAG: ABC transporter permease/M1 family aminopeptidase [Bryobacteraceae bacterium]
MREIPFWAIALIMIVLCVGNARVAGRFRDTAVWPETYLIVSVISGGAMLFLLIVATLYTGEVVWRERDTRFEEIHDSLPLPGWVNWVSQLTAVAAVELILLAVVMVCGIVVQASFGYYHFELGVYFKELFLIDFPSVLSLLLFAFFCHTLISNKFLAHAVVIGVFVLVPVLQRFGLENRLYLAGEVAPYIYSDMNGYGHFVPAVTLTLIYWLAFGGMLAVISMALARRGTDLAWSSRWKQARGRWAALTPAFAVALLIFIASGGWFYYNAHVLNTFRTTTQTRDLRAEYERAYKKYENLPQPRITAVDIDVDIYPERRSFSGRGHYTLVNHTGQPIERIHLSNANESIDSISPDRPFKAELTDKRLGYWIYELDRPLAPDESMRLDFKASYNSIGFRDGNERNDFAYNGTFFDASYFPGIGYNRGVEIGDPVRRREEHLPLLEELAPPGDPYYRNVNLFTPDSEWITFHSVVSTSPDQIAIAPGYLKREWTEKGRRYFEYDMGGTRINNFYSFISGRFAVKKEEYKGVKLEIYYHPGHEYNLDRMLQSARKGIDYFGTNFAPYQFQQFRVLEYPRYRQFAQSFPNTVPYSEGLGFIQRVQKEDDLDEIFYITAHELAHQWWGHQLIGSMTQGSNMMSESLAQYSALMIMEKEYGKDQIRKFLKHELDGYLRGRGSETRREPPLSLVQNEPYVWYNKGSLVMYALRDYMGEERLNAALRKFLLDNRYAKGPYPNSLEFVQNLKDAAPPELKPLVADLFESIILFDNRAVKATWTQTPDKKYKVTLIVDARKLRADGQGSETEIPVNDLIDIGVFSGKENNEKPLYLEKRQLTGRQSKIEMLVNEMPSRAGIDPYNKLIDRKPDDNVIAVSKE